MSIPGRGRESPDVDQWHHNPGIKQEDCVNEPTFKTNEDQPADEINGAGDIQPAKLPQGLLQSKSEQKAITGDEEAPESDQAHIDRLGRARPAKFKSFGAELAFCYSVTASQFMSVRFLVATLLKCEL